MRNQTYTFTMQDNGACVQTIFDAPPPNGSNAAHQPGDGRVEVYDEKLMTMHIEMKPVRLVPVTPQVTLLAATADMERVMAAAGRLCYSRSTIASVMTKLNDDAARTFLSTKIVPTGHHSVIEHALFTFGVEGISRACSHQFVRHRHASFDQQSQRYVDVMSAKQPVYEFVVPPSIASSRQMFVGYIERLKEALRAYAWALRNQTEPEDARMFLPNASATRMVVSMNPRALYEFITKRTCALAQWEIDIVATRIAALVHPHAPSIFDTAGPACSRGKCPEGERCCLIPIPPLVTLFDQPIAPHDFWNGKKLGDYTGEDRVRVARQVRQRMSDQRTSPVVQQ